MLWLNSNLALLQVIAYSSVPGYRLQVTFANKAQLQVQAPLIVLGLDERSPLERESIRAGRRGHELLKPCPTDRRLCQ